MALDMLTGSGVPQQYTQYLAWSSKPENEGVYADHFNAGKDLCENPAAFAETLARSTEQPADDVRAASLIEQNGEVLLQINHRGSYRKMELKPVLKKMADGLFGESGKVDFERVLKHNKRAVGLFVYLCTCYEEGGVAIEADIQETAPVSGKENLRAIRDKALAGQMRQSHHEIQQARVPEGIDLMNDKGWVQLQHRLRKHMKQLEDMKQWPPVHQYPEEGVEVNGPRVYYPDQPFVLKARDKRDGTPGEERQMMVVYVDTGRSIKSRIIYASNTHAVIKSLPQLLVRKYEGKEGEDDEYVVKSLDKGPEQHSTTVSYAYQYHFLNKLHHPRSFELDQLPVSDARDLMRTVIGHEGDHRRRGMEDAVNLSFRGKITSQTALQLQDIAEAAREEVEGYESFYRPEQLYLDDVDQRYIDQQTGEITDIDRFLPIDGVKAVQSSNTVKYGKVNYYFIDSKGPNAKRYVVCEQEKSGKIWIGNIENLATGANDYLVNKKYPRGIKALTTPLYENYDELRSIGGGSEFSNKFFGSFSNQVQSRSGNNQEYDMSGYLELMPVIQVMKKVIQDFKRQWAS